MKEKETNWSILQSAIEAHQNKKSSLQRTLQKV